MMTNTPRTVIAVAVVAVLFAVVPETAAACPVCFDSSEENRLAFLATTALLSLLPLGMVGGAGLWIRKKVRERDENGSE